MKCRLVGLALLAVFLSMQSLMLAQNSPIDLALASRNIFEAQALCMGQWQTVGRFTFALDG